MVTPESIKQMRILLSRLYKLPNHLGYVNYCTQRSVCPPSRERRPQGKRDEKLEGQYRGREKRSKLEVKRDGDDYDLGQSIGVGGKQWFYVLHFYRISGKIIKHTIPPTPSPTQMHGMYTVQQSLEMLQDRGRMISSRYERIKVKMKNTK